ncbi:MAG: HEAT repeat domain-containing protein [Planctomycetota bacterium]
MRTLLVILSFCTLVLMSGCQQSRSSDDIGDDGLFTGSGPITDEEREEVRAEIADLALVAQADVDPDAEVRYNQAVQALTLRGGRVENMVIEELAGSDDWALRYGAINVLDGIGSQACVPAVIAALADEHYMVAFKALHTLRVLCDHREIPEAADAPAGANGLPGIPAPDPSDLDREAALKPWLRWHARYGDALRAAWEAWWQANSTSVIIQ